MPAITHFGRTPFSIFVKVASLSLALIGCSEVTTQDRNQTGRFIDSPVKGLFYQTESASGQTDSAGRFIYRSGSRVRFSLMPNLPLGDGPYRSVTQQGDSGPNGALARCGGPTG